MTTEDWRGINFKDVKDGGNVHIHDNTFVFQEKAASIILDQQPPNVDTFQGREAELGQIQAWVQDASVRLIGITASGGYGKTSLVAKALTQVEGLSLPPLWISFNQPYTFANFGRWLLQQFGQAVDEKVPDEDLLLKAVEQLSQQRGLLVMDNLETLLNEHGQWQEPVYGAFFQRWLSHGRQSTILLTSREGFSLPDNQQGMSRWYALQGLTTDAGVALLEEKGIRGGRADLERFVTLVDGHPLSLSLTAGWLLNPKKTVAPDVTYALNQDDLYRFEQIVGDHRGNPDASVGRILAASVARLTPTLKALWQDLSVYRLAFNRTAAQAMRATATLDDLWELARRSLLQEQPVEGAVQTLEERWQFQFLPLVQRFAQQQANDLTVAHTQAVAYYRSVAQPEPWQELEDVTAYLEAFHHLCELGQYTQANGEITPCDNFLDLQGYNPVRLELYGRLVQAWQQGAWNVEPNDNGQALLGAILNLGNAHFSLSQYAPAIEVYQSLLDLAQSLHDPYYEGAALGSLGNAYDSLGDYPGAVECLRQSLKIKRAIGDRQGEASALGNLGNAYQSLGDYLRAIEFLQQQLDIARAIGSRQGEATALQNLGNAYSSLGDYARAIDCYQKSLVIKQTIGDRQGESLSLGGLGNAYHSLGDYPRAIEYHQQWLDIARAIGDRQGEANALGGLGLAYRSLGDYPQAIEFQQQWLDIARAIGDRRGEASALGNLGNAYYSLGDYPWAIEFQQQQLDIARAISDRRGEANALGGLGNAYHSLGDYPRAIEYQQQQLDIAWAIGDRPGEASALGNLGLAYYSLGDYPRAIEYHQQQLDIARAIGDRLREAIAWFNLGGVQEKMGQPLEAMQCVQQARALFGSMEMEGDVQDCDQALSRLSTPPVDNRSTPRRGWLRRLVGWFLRVVHRLWGRMRRGGGGRE